MKQIIKALTLVIMSFLWVNNLLGQVKLQSPKLPKATSVFKPSAEDSLLGEFHNTVYYTFYNPAYMSNKTTTFTTLKIAIDRQGKIKSINFSDSADTTFVNTWLNTRHEHDDKATLEKYAKIKGYQSVSLLIPVSYQPNYPHQSKIFSFDELAARMKFNKQNFTGKAILLDPIDITVLPKGNM